MRTLKIFREAARMLSGGALLAGLLVMGGCSDDDGFSPDDGDRVAVSFSAGIDGAAIPGVKSGTRSASFGADGMQAITGVTDAGVPYADYVAEDGFPTRTFYPGRQAAIQSANGSGLKTRTTAGGDEWVQNDGVGIFMLTNLGTITTAAHRLTDNKKYNATPGNPASKADFSPDDGTDIYYPQSGNVDFIAYYPHGTINTADYTYNISVTDQTNPAAIDVLYAKTTNVAKSKTAVNLAFDHALSKVTLNVTLGDGLTSLAGSDITAAKLTGMPQTATMALQDGAVTAGTAGDISSLRGTVPGGASYDATFSAILIPQSSGGTNRTIVFTVDGTSYTGIIPNGDIFAPGNHYTYPVTVKKSSVTMGTVSIDNWNTNNNPAGNAEIPPVGMVLIPKGTFQMGSPKDGANGATTTEPNRYNDETQHKVTLTKDFYMSKYPVTNAQYAAFLNAKPIGNDGRGDVSYDKDGSSMMTNEIFIFDSSAGGRKAWGVKHNGINWVAQTGYENHPVIYVTWFGAKAYVDWVSQTIGINCQLPTEAQWEYACRGNYPNKATETATKPFGIGSGTMLYADMANFNGRYPYNNGHIDNYDGLSGYPNTYLEQTTTVGSYSPNNYGLYDMHGNVWEWCLDQWNGNDNYLSLPPTDPLCTAGSFRVLRGGSWINLAQYCRSAYRNPVNPGNASNDFGFRVAVPVP